MFQYDQVKYTRSLISDIQQYSIEVNTQVALGQESSNAVQPKWACTNDNQSRHSLSVAAALQQASIVHTATSPLF